MADSILGGISQEATLQELLGTTIVLLSAILEKLPRTTGNDQAAVSVEGTATVALASNQTLATVTNTAQLGGKPALAVADSITQVGALHLYDKITVS